jgi:hypothetical protein
MGAGRFLKIATLMGDMPTFEDYRQASAKCAVVTERAKNLFHEVLIKLRSSLDFVMCRIYRMFSTLQGEKKAKGERQVVFPFCDKETEFRRKLKSVGLSCLETQNPALYALLRQSQPFRNKNRVWLAFREFSNLGKHVKLAKQVVKLRPAKRFTGPDGQVAIVTEGTISNHGKSDGPWPNCRGVDITWATIEVYMEDGEDVFPGPLLFCLDLRLSLRSYVQEILALL